MASYSLGLGKKRQETFTLADEAINREGLLERSGKACHSTFFHNVNTMSC